MVEYCPDFVSVDIREVYVLDEDLILVDVTGRVLVGDAIFHFCITFHIVSLEVYNGSVQVVQKHGNAYFGVFLENVVAQDFHVILCWVSYIGV